jgi:hypothetical protein
VEKDSIMIIIDKSSNVVIIKNAKNSNGGVLDLTTAEITATFKQFSTASTSLFVRRNTAAGGGDTELKATSPTNGIYEIKIVPANTSALTIRSLCCVILITIDETAYTETFYLKIRDNKDYGDIYSYPERGTTAQRPTLTAGDVGFQYFDTSLNSPIWWSGSEWL